MSITTQTLTAEVGTFARRPSRLLISSVAATVLAAGLAIALLTNNPEPSGGTAELDRFSAERARVHVDRIGGVPHPIGSSEHAAVRNYIISELSKTGLQAQVQRTTSVNTQRGIAANVENVLARFEGRVHDGAVLLVAHYDSVATGDGAADDGAGVASLLETASALRHSPKLNRDVIFLFSDGEENGLFGARAFVDQHPWAKTLGIVLNFEARGTSGPVVMFETSSPNGSLVREFGATAAHPVASSLSYEIYTRLPNDTDFTVFRKAGYAGLNFAFIRHLGFYHTELDKPRDLALSSLQQEGDNMLALTRRFASTGERPSGGNAVYFDALGRVLFVYSITAAYAFLGLTVCLLLVVLWAGFRWRRIFTAKGLFRGFAGLLLALLVGLATAWLVSLMSSHLRSVSAAVRTGLLYHSDLFVIAFIAASASITLLVFRWVVRAAGLANFAAAGLILWALLAAATTFAVPGASYIFVWPLIFMLAGWAAFFIWRGGNGVVAPLVASLPAVLLWVPLISSIIDAFAGESVLIVTLLLLLLICLLTLAFDAVFDLARLRLPALAGILAVGFFSGALAVSHADRDHPTRFNLLWARDADTGKQTWISFDRSPSRWASTFFSSSPGNQTVTEFFPRNFRKLPAAPAGGPALSAPTATILEDSHTEAGRRLRLAIKSARHAPILYISFDRRTPVSKVSVNHKAITPNEGDIFFYAVPEEGIELDFEAQTSASVRLDVKDISYGLPQSALEGHPRPDDVIPAPSFLNNSSMVKKSFSL